MRKKGAMKFIGHLDMMRYFQKAIRRAGIDVAYSEGFSPHMIMSFAAPLGVGVTSSGEYFDMEVQTPLSTADFGRRFNAVMAEGIRVMSVREIPDQKASKAIIAGGCRRLLCGLSGGPGTITELQRTDFRFYGTAFHYGDEKRSGVNRKRIFGR